MDELKSYRQDLLLALGNVINRLSDLTARLPSDAWQQPSRPGENTPHYILCHLDALEGQVFTSQLLRFILEDTPTLTLFDDQAWMAVHYRPDQPASEVIEDISRLRNAQVAWLEKLPPAGWGRLARHPWWGMHALQWWVELQLDESIKHLALLPVR